MIKSALALCSILFSVCAAAQTFPQTGKPVRIVVPFAPGGQTDIQARAIAHKVAATLGVSVIVENKPGGSTVIGAREVQKAAPDGHTLLYTIATHVQIPHLYKVPPWNVFKDFTPITPGAKSNTILTAHASMPFNNVAELVAYAKANPGKLNYASSGNGSIQHIAGELFKQLTGTFITHIPYRGSGPAVQDLMAGQVDIFITTPAGVVSQIQGGKLKGIAVTSKQRLSSLPQVGTAAEQGLNGYELDSWFALYAPAGTPADIVQTLNTEINKILTSPEARKKAEDSGTGVAQMTPQQLGEFTRKELDYWGKVIQGAKITLE
jgi:tripartite-type tricarboxylate transporter receptor subunit TctC